MKIVVRNRILIALSVLLVLSVLSFALTQARYSTEKNPDNNTGELHYTIADQIIVYDTEQFFAAVANGYSNVKIGDTVSNPFLVSGSADVTSDLILDLNGHEIQRNSREPMLTINEGVKMIVTDTSKSQKGSFYNPVGSVLKIDGGVLTVMNNKFESGPRANEYFSNNKEGVEYIGGQVAQVANIKVETKNADTGYTENNKTNVPILLPYVDSSTPGANFVNGNIYFDKDATAYGAAYGAAISECNTELVKADTYFYFTIDDKNAASQAIAASTSDADFRYSYNVYKNGSNYEYNPAQPAENAIKVTIYGYKNVIASARNEVAPYNTTPSNFAAIKMIKGSMYSRGGQFFSYFGVDTSSCIYADEGSLSVYGGSYTALDEGVAVKCNYLEPDSEFTIVDGTFKSFKGDTIQMQNGELVITGGTFVKDASAYTEGNPGANNNNAAINLLNGKIKLNSAAGTPINFYLAGRYMAAIQCGAAAEINSYGVNFQFGTNGKDSIEGGNNIGILGEGGNVNVENCVFIQPGDYSYGIYSYDKTDAGVERHSIDVVSSIFSMGGERCTGIYANGGIINIGCEDDLYNPNRGAPVYGPGGSQVATGVSIDNYTIFYLDHVANCYGVYVEKAAAAVSTYATDTRINVYAAQFIVGSGTNAAGQSYAEIEIPDNSRESGGTYVAYDSNTTTTKTISVGDLQHQEKVWSAGIYINDNTATVSLGKVRMIVGGSYAAGIFAEKGNIERLYDPTKDKDYVQSDEYKNKVPTIALFVGTRMVGYQNGGYLNKTATEKNKKWNYLYKHDYDYVQRSDFLTYYDRIVNCDSTDDYGIAAKSGTVHLGRIYLNLRSKYSRGIYASSGESISKVEVDNCIANIDNKNKVLVDGEEKYVIPETLTTTTMTIRNGHVTIHDADVRTNAVGIVINNGQLNFESKINFQAVNASAIYMTSTAMVSGGTSGSKNNLTIGADAKVSIFCNITERTTDEGVVDLTTPIPWKLKNVHNRSVAGLDSQLPAYTESNKSNQDCMLSYNGINIKGGSVTCDGELIVDFHGVNNKNQTGYDPYNIPLSGCAINVEQLTGSDAPTVNLWHAHITSGKAQEGYDYNSVFYGNDVMKDVGKDISESNAGGGISVKGGNVRLGKKLADESFYTDTTSKGYQVLHNEHNDDRNELITIETFGNSRYGNVSYDAEGNKHKDFNYLDNTDSAHSYTNWKYAVSETGGPGIKVESGSIIVRHGTYYAAQGNGILLVGGEATVYDGIFKGKNTEWNLYNNEWGDKTGSGLGSFYGFMLRGGGELTIYDGLFEGFNGGAFVVGSSTTNTAVAKVYGGTFEDMPERRTQRLTTNGFSVGPYSTVTIGWVPTLEVELPGEYKAPKILGIACGIAVENNASLNPDGKVEFKSVSITIQGGAVVRATKLTREDHVNAIWKGNDKATLIFGECTLLFQKQVKNADGTYSDGDMIPSDEQNRNQIINNDNSLWKDVVIDTNTYQIFSQTGNGVPTAINYDTAHVGDWCSKIEIKKIAESTTPETE